MTLPYDPNRIYEKDPAAVLDYELDWSDWLDEITDTLIGATWEATGGMEVDDESFEGGVATVWLSGGDFGRASATCHVTTAGGRTDERTLPFRIVNR